MVGRLHRTQILLEPKQHERLIALAQRENRSLSDKVRDIIARYLAENDDSLQLNQELTALANLSRIREETAQAYGIYSGDPIADARAEREIESDKVLSLPEERL
jgi:predicted DNA-binding protein